MQYSSLIWRKLRISYEISVVKIWPSGSGKLKKISVKLSSKSCGSKMNKWITSTGIYTCIADKCILLERKGFKFFIRCSLIKKN